MTTRHDSTGIMAAIYASAACLLLLVSQAANAATPAWIPPGTSGWPSVPDIGSRAKAAMADLDGDGFPDLMIGAADGKVYAFKNSGTTPPTWTEQPGWEITTPCNVSTSGASNPQTFSSPALGDMDGDGRVDLLVGTRDGVCAYQNTGTGTPVWTRQTTWDITVANVSRFYAPALGDLNGDNKLDVMLGSNSPGDVQAYQNIRATAPSAPVWSPNSAWSLFALSVLTSPTLGDIDGDGLIDLMVGDQYGTVFTFKNVGSNAVPSWKSAGSWYIGDPDSATLNYAGPALGDLNHDGVADVVMYGDTSGVTFAYQKNPAGLPDPGYASAPPPSTGSPRTETFETFGCTGAWNVAAGGPNTSYTRDCGNGWTAYAEDTANAATPGAGPGPVGDQNVVTLDSTANGPSISSSTPGAAEMYTTPDTARGTLWLLKTFPVTARATIKSISSDFRMKVVGGGGSPTRQYYGMVVFDGAVSNPSGLTVAGLPQRTDVLASDIHFDQCGSDIWCSWNASSLTNITPSSSTITVALMVQDTNTAQTSYAELDNLKVTDVATVASPNVPTGDIAQLWKQEYADPANDPTIGIDNWSQSKDMKLDSAGNVYIAADTYNGTNYDIAVFKYDSSGNLLWHQSYDGGDSDQAVALGLDGAGNVYVAGRSFGAGTNADFIVVKYNSSGTPQWAVPYDNLNRVDDPTGLVVDSSGNSYVTGSSCSDFGSWSCTFLTVKYDTSGTVQWHATFDNGGASVVSKSVGIGMDSSGNVYVAGTVSGGSDDIATVMYDNASGAQLGHVIYDGGTNDRAVVMKTDGAGNVYVVGYTYNSGTPAILVLKYSFTAGGAATLQWKQLYSSLPEALPTAMAIDGGGNIYIAGVVGSSIDHKFVTLKLASNGGVAWAQSFGSTGEDAKATAIAVDGMGNVYVAGSMVRYGTNSDIVLVRYDASGVARNAITSDGYSLNDVPVSLALGVDAQGDTAPYVTGVSDDTSGIKNIITLRYTKALPDLTVTYVANGGASAQVGTQIPFTSTVLNIADLANKIYANSGPFDVGLYIAPSIGGLPDMSNVTQLGTRHLDNLAPGTSSTVTTQVTIPSNLPEGTYVLFATADIGGTVVEADETNNTGVAGTTINIQGVLPDLAASTFVGPSSASPGSTFDTSVTLVNLVSTGTSTDFHVGIYASTTTPVTTADTLVGGYTKVGGLGSFGTFTTTISVTAPATAGQYYLAAIVDDQNAVTEADETNNTTYMVTVPPSSTLLTTKSDFVAGLPGTNVAVAITQNAANVRLSQSVAWSPQSAWDSADVGAYAKPALGDLTGDGLSDLVMGASNGQIYTYVNTGSASAPQWTAAPSSTWNISTPCSISGGTNPQTFSVPRLADLNGDGLLDLVVGHKDGVCIYQNTGSNTAPAWTFSTTWTSSFSGLTTTRFYAPAVADLNNDGKPDIMLGNITSTVLAYANSGSVSAPSWTPNTGWNLTGAPSSSRNTPALADLDGDGDFDLMLATSSGTVYGYRNDGGLTGPSWVPNSAWDFPNPGFTTTSNPYAGVAIGDLNGDGSLDMLYGDYDGVAHGFVNVGVFPNTCTSLSPADCQYTSKVVDAGTHGAFTTLNYTAVVPTGTALAIDVRAGDTPTPDSSWNTITNVPNGGDISGLMTGLTTGQYVQYIFRYTTTNTAASPAVYSIQANTALPPPSPITVGVVVGGGSGGGELSLTELVLLDLLVLAGMGRRRRKLKPL